MLIKLSKRKKTILYYAVAVVLALLCGLIFIPFMNRGTITDNDVLEIQISFDRIEKRKSGADIPQTFYVLFTTDDDKVYSTSMTDLFKINEFNAKINKNDKLTLKVLKQDYEKNTNQMIGIVSIQKDGQYFMEYSAALKKYNLNRGLVFWFAISWFILAGAILTALAIHITILTLKERNKI